MCWPNWAFFQYYFFPLRLVYISTRRKQKPHCKRIRETRPNSIKLKKTRLIVAWWCHKRWSFPSKCEASADGDGRLREWRMPKDLSAFETHNWHYCWVVFASASMKLQPESYEIADCWSYITTEENNNLMAMDHIQQSCVGSSGKKLLATTRSTWECGNLLQ